MAYQQLWQCQLCGYVLDPAEGDADHGIMPRMSYEGIFPANLVVPGVRRGEGRLPAPRATSRRPDPVRTDQLLLPDRGPSAVGCDGHRPRPGRPRVARALGRAPAPPHHAPRRLPRGRGRRRRAARAFRRCDRGHLGGLFLQRRDEERHALLFDRIAAEVLGLPGATPAQRRAAARAHVPAAVLELFEVRLPALGAELAAGRTGLGEGVGLYHMLLEGIVLYAGQRALLDDLAAGALPGVREGVERVEFDERWHIGFGLRCLIEAQPSPALLDDLLARAEDAAAAWGDAVPAATRERIARMCARRLSVAGLIERPAAA
jgi:rubredoxin